MKSLSTVLFFISLIFVAITCREDPPKPPQRAECDKGFLPCEEDSTICCEVICPPGHLLGGSDSTECLPVECPEFHHLCGVDSTVCCLDTTSHEMVWEVDTIFSGITNWVYDAAIINDTNIWVVGWFEKNDPNDSLKYFDKKYNLIKWNGTEWILDHIMEKEWDSIARAGAIFVVDENNIWVTEYGSPMFWNGQKWEIRHMLGWESMGSQVNKIWASGPDDVFFVSNQGKINHWDGSTFTRMQTPETIISLTDIWGTGPNDVWATGWSLSLAKSVVFHFDGDQWDLLYETGEAGHPNTMEWAGHLSHVQSFRPKEVIILANPYGIYQATLDSVIDTKLHEIEFKGNILENMRGNHPHDLFVGASYSTIFHFNGRDFYEYEFPSQILIKAIDVKDDRVVMIGVDNWNVVAVRGRKLN